MRKNTIAAYEIIEKMYSVVFPDYTGEVYIIDENCFEYYIMWKGQYGGPWVTIQKNNDEKWYYIRLNNVSISEQFDNLQNCIDTAFNDMLRAKY